MLLLGMAGERERERERLEPSIHGEDGKTGLR
jgi:hypothetical protein